MSRSLALAALLAVASCSGPLPADQEHHDHDDTVGHDLSHLCVEPSVRSVASGAWADPAIWSPARVPATGDAVLVSPGDEVTYGHAGDDALETICVDGVLRARPDVSTRLVVGTLVVRPSGRLEVGRADAPVAADVTAEIVIADRPFADHDPEQLGTGVLVSGAISLHGAPRAPTFVRLAAAPAADASVLALSEAATGWRAGDRLVLPDTRQTRVAKDVGLTFDQLEEVVVASVDGATITLAEPLRFAHAGREDLLPHVANLTRNVVIRSAEPDGTRGHVMVTGRAVADLRFAAFEDLGRTTVGVIDNTRFDDAGEVAAIGRNQIGRYSLHFHHLAGPVNPANTGHQYAAVGNVVEGGRKWGITIHQSHFGLVQDNVVYDVQGAGIATEDGNETGNEIVHNFAVRISSPRVDDTRGGIGDKSVTSAAGLLLDTGFSGDGFWCRGPNNVLRGNVAANTSFAGFNYNGYYLRGATVPLVRGADPTQLADRTQWRVHAAENLRDVEGEVLEAIPLLESSDNEAYAGRFGMWVTWPNGTMSIEKSYVRDSVVERFTAWNVHTAGIEAWHLSRWIYRGVRLHDDPQVSASNEGGRRINRGFAMHSPSYETGKLVIEDADVTGFNVGIDLPQRVTNDDSPDFFTSRIAGARLRNHVNVADNLATTPKRTELSGITFEPPAIPSPLARLPAEPKHVYMRYSIDHEESRVLAPSALVIDDSNLPSMEVFFTEQHPDFVVPQSDDPTRGYPVAGLTNAQGMAAYGRAVAGALLPADAITRGDVHGYVRLR